MAHLLCMYAVLSSLSLRVSESACCSLHSHSLSAAPSRPARPQLSCSRGSQADTYACTRSLTHKHTHVHAHDTYGVRCRWVSTSSSCFSCVRAHISSDVCVSAAPLRPVCSLSLLPHCAPLLLSSPTKNHEISIIVVLIVLNHVWYSNFLIHY